MSNRLDFTSSPTGTTIIVPDYAAAISFPTREQIKYIPTLDGATNIQRRITDDREIKIVYESVKEREAVMTGTAVSGGSATEFNTDLTAYINDTFNGYYLKFTSGAQNGEERLIGDFVKTNGVITTAAFPGIPGNDSFTIYRLAAWVDELKAQKYVLTDRKFTLSVATDDGNAMDFDYLPETSTVIILDVQDDEVIATSVKQVIKRVTVILRKVPS